MKIAIQTITNGDNYGNRLQNYALQRVLSDYNVETFVNDSYKKESIINFFKYYIKKVINFVNFQKHKRHDKFNEFNKKYIIFSKIHTHNKLKYNDDYDVYICGSDQIWNSSFKENGRANFLMFAKSEKTISYSASFGISNISDERKQEYTKYLNHLRYLSVREEQGKEIIKQLTNNDKVEVLIDPTLLLSVEDWKKIEKKPVSIPNKKYILCYFLGNISNDIQGIIYDYANKNDYEIINILDRNSKYYCSGPSEFIWLEENASLICTDSFHSSVFAFIFDKPFIIFNRDDKFENMSSRLDNFINKFKLEGRKFNNKIDDSCFEHDYSNGYYLLEKEKEKSMNYINNSINSIKDNLGK